MNFFLFRSIEISIFPSFFIHNYKYLNIRKKNKITSLKTNNYMKLLNFNINKYVKNLFKFQIIP